MPCKNSFSVVLEDYSSIKEVLNNDIWVDRYFDDFLAQRSFGKALGNVINFIFVGFITLLFIVKLCRRPDHQWL